MLQRKFTSAPVTTTNSLLQPLSLHLADRSRDTAGQITLSHRKRCFFQLEADLYLSAAILRMSLLLMLNCIWQLCKATPIK